MTAGPTTALMRKAYARWAPIYDVVYDKLTEPAARAAVAAATACGPRVLEVGVGTGLALGYYPPGRRGARGRPLGGHAAPGEEKVDRRGLVHVKSLQVMDATRLGFPDGHFDAVTAQFLITLVPDPEAALTEFARVLQARRRGHPGEPFRPASRACRRKSRNCACAGFLQHRLELRLQGLPRSKPGPAAGQHGRRRTETALSRPASSS